MDINWNEVFVTVAPLAVTQVGAMWRWASAVNAKLALFEQKLVEQEGKLKEALAQREIISSILRRLDSMSVPHT